MAEVQNAEGEKAPPLGAPADKPDGNMQGGSVKDSINAENGPVDNMDADAGSPEGKRDMDSAGGESLKQRAEHGVRDGGEEDTGDGMKQEEGHVNGNREKENGAAAGDDSDDDPFAGLNDVASMDIYDISNYTFGKKNEESKAKWMKQMSRKDMMRALEERYNERGMRRSVGGVILVHAHNFPHILLLQRTDGSGEFALPGGRLRPGESDEEGLKRKLASKLRPPEGSTGAEEDQELEIGEKLCNWYAIDFKRRYYPYVPAHVTKPKEELHVYTVLLPSKFMFSVPQNLQLVAVPLFELFNNATIYGDVISAIPALLSRWHINFC